MLVGAQFALLRGGGPERSRDDKREPDDRWQSADEVKAFTRRLGPLLLAQKLPAICEWREMTVSGCLASYGTTLHELYSITAALTDKMLKGARPANTPAQQPTKFELVINLKVARTVGVNISPSILDRADEVIE